MITASVCTIGDEILIGQIVDTNSSAISTRLGSIGVKVTGMVSIGDDHRAIVDELAAERATREVPPQAEEHWRLITQMREAVEALRAFERRHQVKDAPLFYLARMSESQLFEAWINRDILLERMVIGGKVITPQKIKQLFY